MPCKLPPNEPVSDMLDSPLTSKDSLWIEDDTALLPVAVGVRLGVAELTLFPPYSIAYLERFAPRAAGKLAEDGTGEGVNERKSANDLAGRKFCLLRSGRPDGEVGTSRSEDAPRPIVEYKPSDLASVKSIVMALAKPRRCCEDSTGWTVVGMTDDEMVFMLETFVGGLKTWTWRCSPVPRETWARAM